MTIRVALHHKTHYTYDRPVRLSPQVIRLRPAPHCRTPVVSYALNIQPEEQFLNWQQDPYGNYLARLVFPELTREFSVNVELITELTVINPFDFFLEPDATELPFNYSPALLHQLQPYLAVTPMSETMRAFVNGVPDRATGTVDFLVDLNQYVHNAVGYVIRLEPGVQTCEQTLELRSGSCRDSAWLLVQTLRHLGLAARFVSGYLIQLKPDVKPLDGPAGSETDFSDLHAWAEVYLPGAGWVGLDPTSGLLAGEGHLPLAATPDPESAAPITGGVDECKVDFDFEMSVTRVHEDPRVTKPYTDEQWQRIECLGERVDRSLAQGPRSLTMGGEPTFVSMDDRDAPEWNTAALGPSKRRLGGQLFRGLAKRFATAPLMHFGQGKWYPGESLPRWALNCYWRRDLEPIWSRSDLVAEDNKDYGCGEQTALLFLQALAEQLGVTQSHILPGFEDSWYYLWRERKLPVNVDPIQSNLKDPEERERLARIFEKGLEQVVGYVLPLCPSPHQVGTQPRWRTGPWFLRQERMFLIPGDSPMGYRLPLDSLPWVAPQDYPHVLEMDPLAERSELPRNIRQELLRRQRGLVNAPTAEAVWIPQIAGVNVNGDANFPGWSVPEEPESNGQHPPGFQESASDIVRTALCAESRDGILHLFMPPVSRLEHYLDLVHAIEIVAEQFELPVRIEGYTPPRDYRLESFGVTPDPGVIEVNLQPAKSWRELVHNTDTLYEEARKVRLCTEKFMIDGRHTGTGGGNHIVLGGPTPAESPFLRRPDLLRSLVAYWNNHPSLSYLFSGLFIGPTSQAPRADEARHESLYELETACAQLPDHGPTPSWLVDRVFRHLLVDLTGNTHRAEFCIDKLFSPDSASGRLGLVELRGFEMPPHERMSLAQQLLVRSLVAHFWQSPYKLPLIRWGTTLHDRFMLPHFVEQDLEEVLFDLKRAGFEFDIGWFDPHFEFRFPLIGKVAQRGIVLELRQAIEPWHVLGEEPAGGGTARFVDSSVERVQVRVQGWTDPRYVISCNGRRVPLRPTGTQGEAVAGVRFRAWQPPSCLHPTIGVHSPLVFDIVDTWNNRSMGGCTWHVSHPGGRSFDTLPVNSYEAESRRVARFFPIGQTTGACPIPEVELNADYPLTLDLRRPLKATMPGVG
ncbi:MAG: transglutaminase family protein [Planctomycetales bacterium]